MISKLVSGKTLCTALSPRIKELFTDININMYSEKYRLPLERLNYFHSQIMDNMLSFSNNSYIPSVGIISDIVDDAYVSIKPYLYNIINVIIKNDIRSLDRINDNKEMIGTTSVSYVPIYSDTTDGVEGTNTIGKNMTTANLLNESYNINVFNTTEWKMIQKKLTEMFLCYDI